MICIYIIAGCVLALLLLFLFLIAPKKPSSALTEPFINRNYAHRGLHTKDKKIPENSMSAFAAAVNAGYGIELDIQFSKDEQIVVFHDDDLPRVCHTEGKVCDFTYAELQRFHLHKTKETLPLFQDVLALVDGKVPLIVELKNGSKNDLLCEKSLAMLRAYHGPFCVESFQPLIVGWFKKHAPDLLRGQLSASAKELREDMSSFLAFGLSHVLSNFYARPHFIAYHTVKRSVPVKLAENLGAMRVVWTSKDEKAAKALEQSNDAVIFERYLPAPKYK